MRYRLRTLFVVLAAACAIAAFVGYRMRARNPDRDFLAGCNHNFNSRVTDPSTVAKLLRERSELLPRHQATDKQIIRLSENFFFAGYQKLQRATLIHRFFYNVKLSDGSETRVGFWIYRKDDGGAGATLVVYGGDHHPPRNHERDALFDSYQDMIEAIEVELGESSPTVK